MQELQKAELDQWIASIAPDHADNARVYGEIAVDDREGRLLMRGKIDTFQRALEEIAGDSRGCADEINDNGLVEHIADGAYVRQLLIPKGVFIASKIWKRERMWIIATGEVTFTTEMGTQRVKAPFTKIVPPGSKVALFTHEETLWFAITGTKAKTMAEVESEVVTDNYSDCRYPWDAIEGGIV